MRLHEDEKLFRQAVNTAAAHLGIPEIFNRKGLLGYLCLTWFHCLLDEVDSSRQVLVI